MKKYLIHSSTVFTLAMLLSAVAAYADDDIYGDALSACPPNSQLINGVCECNVGLEFDPDAEVCINANDWCEDTYGPNAHYELPYDLCVCDTGYAWVEDLQQCVTLDAQCKHVYGSDYSYIDGFCVTEDDGSGGTSTGSESGIFTDISESHQNYDAISYLKNAGIIQGYSDGSFKPDQTVNRAELLKIIIEGKGFTPFLVDYNNCFDDVSNEWYAAYICYAESVNWVDGYADGTYKPGQDVNNVEALKILLNAYEVTVPASVDEAPFTDIPVDSWYAPFVDTAKELGILEEVGAYFTPGASRSRAQISENLYRLLQ